MKESSMVVTLFKNWVKNVETDQINIVSGNGLSPNRIQVIAFTNGDQYELIAR